MSASSSDDEAMQLLRKSVVDDPYELAILDLQMAGSGQPESGPHDQERASSGLSEIGDAAPHDNQPDAAEMKAADIAGLVLKPAATRSNSSTN